MQPSLPKGDNMPDNIFQKLCCKLTNHKFRKLEGWSVGIEPTEYHWKCKICRKRFWNYKPKRKQD